MILINEPLDFPADSLSCLERLGPVFMNGSIYDPDEINIIFIRIDSKIDACFLNRFKSLKYVVSPTTGLTHIDLKELQRRNIKIISLKGHVDFLNDVHATAEHTIALTLALLRRIQPAVKSVEAGNWNRYPFKGEEINGRNVFLIGYGRVGRQVDQLFKAFGAKVMAFDSDDSVVPLDKKVTLEYGLKTAKIISVHISYSKKNIGFLSKKLLAHLSPDAILINTSRGEIIDQQALFTYLRADKIAGAALDVLCHEPTPIDDIVTDSISSLGGRLLITPHLAGFTVESLKKVERYVSQLLIDEWSA